MAHVTFDKAYDDLLQMITDFSHLKFDAKHSSADEFVYVDGNSKDKIIIDGSNLHHDAHGLITKGTVNELHFELPTGDHLVDVTKLNISGKTIHDAFENHDANALLNKVFGGDDTFTGSNGNDYIMGWAGDDVIDGGKGNDTLTGYTGDDTINVKQGNDVVFFDHGYGHDTVLHFDAHGGDLIWTLSSDYKILGAHNNQDTIIKFDNQDELLLVGVNHHDVTKADFYHVHM